jgi:hypothetical protein
VPITKTLFEVQNRRGRMHKHSGERSTVHPWLMVIHFIIIPNIGF